MSNGRYIYNVTFPRSGHHLLASCLKHYLEDEFRYCEWYQHCRRSPCTSPQTNWQKHHDFDLRLAKSPQHRYVIQIRHPVESIASWYLWELRAGIPAESNGLAWVRFVRKIPRWPDLVRIVRPDTEGRWRHFLWRKLKFWKQFVHKWIIDHASANTYVLPYHRFVGHAEHELIQIIRFGWPDSVLDKAKIRHIVTQHQFSLSRSLTRFQHLDVTTIREAEDFVRPQLAALEIEEIS